jgi:large subunit ribosomal protein L22
VTSEGNAALSILDGPPDLEFEAYDSRARASSAERALGDGALLTPVQRPSLQETNVMQSKATAMFSRIAPRKARMIANLVRGRNAAEAIQLLQFTTKAGAPVLKKLIESAIANAQRNNADIDALYVSKATVDKGPTKFNRRWRPRAMGRATRIEKGISHIVIELDQRK